MEATWVTVIIQSMRKYDIMASEDTRKLYRQMNIEQASSKYTLPKHPSSDGYYHLWVQTNEGRKQIKAKSLDRLKEKLYDRTIITFHDCFVGSQEQRLKYTKNEERLLSVRNTVTRNYSIYKRYFANTAFETYRVDEITKKDIEDICFYNLNRYELTNKGFLNFRSAIKQTLQYAYEEGYAFENVYNRVNFRKFQDMLVEQTKIKDRVHSEEELNRMIDYCHKQQIKYPNKMVSFALELQIAMGLRRGEVTALRWDDVKDGYIEISREQITINGSHLSFAIVNHTKTYIDRKFPITDEVQNILDRIPRTSEYLFTQKNELGCIKNNGLYNYYYRMCEQLGIELNKTAIKGTHSFRRNAITKAVNNSNGNVYLTSKIYGNSPKTINAHYYTDINLDEARTIVSKGNQKVTN